MLPLTPTPVALDKPRAIAFTMRARYRMGTLDRPFSLADLANRRKSYAALVAWIWASLTPEHAADFPTPDDLAEHLTIDQVSAVMKALGDAIKAAEPNKKNGDGSTSGPSPSSST